MARVEERLVVEAEPHTRQRVADVSIADTGRHVGAVETETESGETVAVVLPALSERTREVYLEILDSQSGDLVTLIDLLSPSNRRPHAHRNEFLQKRDEILGSHVNDVEIDLLRAEPRLPIDGLPKCDYYVLIRDAAEARNARVYPIQLSQRLPVVTMPLREPERVDIDLQNVFDETFDEGRYAPQIYDVPPDTPLTAEQLAWAKSHSADRSNEGRV